jgi:hypothetical protein
MTVDSVKFTVSKIGVDGQDFMLHVGVGVG